MRITIALLLLLTICVATLAQAPQSDLKQFIRVDSNVVALTHVRIVDGTGAAPLEDQTLRAPWQLGRGCHDRRVRSRAAPARTLHQGAFGGEAFRSGDEEEP